MTKQIESVPVRPGQIWRDNDKRCKRTRYLKVLSIDIDGFGTAFCNVEEVVYCSRWQTVLHAKPIRIAVQRMRPTASGYTLVSEASK